MTLGSEWDPFIAAVCGYLYTRHARSTATDKENIMASISPYDADNDETPDDGIEIEFEAIDEKPLKYEAHVLKLIDADAKRTKDQIEDGLHATVKLTFPKEEKGKPAVERYKRWFRESAAAHNVSAKVISETDEGENVIVKYAVVEKIVRPRKNKETPAAETSANDAPAAETKAA